MDLRKKSIQFCKLPLVIAIGTVFLASCSSNTAPVSGTTATRIPVAQNEAVSNVPATDGSYSTSLLDDESLAELENLLEATDMKMVEDDKLAISQYGDLWDRMRAGFRMNQSYGYSQQQRIDAQKNWFITRQEYINRLTARASRYLYHTIREAERRNIPTELALLPVIESSYDPTGTSNAAAAGLWQFIPSTGRIYGLTQTPTYDGRRDVIESTRAAYDFLTSLYNQFGSWELALASYNAGPGRVQKAIDANRARGLPTDYWSLSLPTETMHYVPRFMAVAQIVKDTNQYSIALPAIANRQHFRSVPVNYGVSLYEVSQLTGVSYEELKALNPALTSGSVDPSGPNRVIIPNQINILVDSKLSSLRSNGIASGASTSPYSIPDSQYEVMAKSPEGLAEFASMARAPQQTSSYIAPVVSPSMSAGVQEPPISDAEKKRIESELAKSNTLPTTSAQLTQNVTIVQEPPLSPEEKEFISQQIRQQSPDIGEVVSSVDGNIKLEAIQTQQSILEARGEEKRISFDRSTSTPPSATSPTTTQQQRVTPPKPAGTRSVYTVQRGDTLVNIASRAGLNWRDIADWNQINPNSTLLTGTKLYLYNAKPIAPLGSGAKADTSHSGAQPNTYIVRPGDTLTGTAERVGLSVSRLASYNGLSTNARLRTGQKLWLIPGMVKTNTSTSSASKSSSAYQGKTQNYTVKRGEGLIALAARYNVPVETLAAMNDLEPNEQLLVGQRLKVPAHSAATTATAQPSTMTIANKQASSSYQGETSTYTVQSGDTLIGIANKLGVPHTQIAEMNNISATGQLLRGQKLKLPASKQQVAVSVSNKPISYKVRSGDSLTSVANKYGVSLSVLANANNLSTTSNLIIGQSLTVPAAGSSSQPKTSSTTQKSSSNKASNTAPNYTGTYKVKAGDGLINLAREYGISAADLAAANNISANAGLHIGQTLKVPNTKPSSATTTSSASKTNNQAGRTPAKAVSGANYTVKSGDSLNRLASQHGLTVAQLASANGLSTTSQLQIGQKIIIPATTTTYKVKSGDSLIGLAKKYGMSPEKFAELNGISSSTMLQIGQTLKVPVQ